MIRDAHTDIGAGGTSTEDELWPGMRLGDPISLADFLARPVVRDRRGTQLDRDEQGRLCLMAPDEQYGHRVPIAGLLRVLFRHLEERLWTVPEPSLALPHWLHLDGTPIPPSPLGLQALEPDLMIFGGRPKFTSVTSRGRQGCLMDGARLVIEVLSPSTFRNDLGLGRSDNVDRWASYLASGVPELWVLNIGVGRPCPLPPRSGLFLRNAGDRWEPLPVDGAQHATGEVHGVTPVSAGRVRSLATGTQFGLAPLWEEVIGPDDGPPA